MLRWTDQHLHHRQPGCFTSLVGNDVLEDTSGTGTMSGGLGNDTCTADTASC